MWLVREASTHEALPRTATTTIALDTGAASEWPPHEVAQHVKTHDHSTGLRPTAHSPAENSQKCYDNIQYNLKSRVKTPKTSASSPENASRLGNRRRSMSNPPARKPIQWYLDANANVLFDEISVKYRPLASKHFLLHCKRITTKRFAAKLPLFHEIQEYWTN